MGYCQQTMLWNNN